MYFQKIKSFLIKKLQNNIPPTDNIIPFSLPSKELKLDKDLLLILSDILYCVESKKICLDESNYGEAKEWDRHIHKNIEKFISASSDSLYPTEYINLIIREIK